MARERTRTTQAERRIARAESECNATILRAINRLMRVLERERTEWLIYKDRKRKKVIR